MFTKQELELFERLMNKEKTVLVDSIREYDYNSDIESLRVLLNLLKKTEETIQSIETFPETQGVL